jgi:2,4-dienoyl-CoA reductase-like NADH-dependent reductase (Old Yellow Enzyme family)
VSCHNRLQALYSNGGYTYLDVRTQLEVEEVGKIKDSVNIPLMLASRKYDPETREKKLVKEQNTDFIRQVRPAAAASSSWGGGGC